MRVILPDVLFKKFIISRQITRARERERERQCVREIEFYLTALFLIQF
jgi:hypothetical protein